MADFIMDLRKMIGNIPIILCTASVIVMDAKGQILLQQRSDNGQWGIPGGCVELGETVKEAAIREVFEETGIIVTDLQLFDVYSGEIQHYIYPNGDEVYFNNTVFVTYQHSGTISLAAEESKDVAFFDLYSLPEVISPVILPIIEDFRKSI